MIDSKAPRKVFVHLQVANPNGAVKSDLMNYHVACDPTSSIPESWTPVIVAVTCPLCMETTEYAEISGEQSHASTADRKAHEHAAKIAKADTPPPNTDETTPPAE